MTTPEPRDWFLSRRARGNPATTIDAAHTGADAGAAHSTGNLAHPLIHGSTYFAELYRTIEATGAGDLVWFTDWQSDPDQQLTDDPASTLLEVLGRAVDRGVDVRALVWRSQPSFAGYAHEEHRELGKALQERGAEVLLDMRVRRGGAHHQKFCVVRHAEAQHRDVAFVGGIDLCHGRRDDALHGGDPQPEEMSSEYGPRPPWHDVQVALRGPVVHDVETVFRERWDDPIPTTRHPLRRLRDAADGLDRTRSPLPLQSPPPPPVPGADHAVQLLRTYPALGWGWSHGFAPRGERSVARGYTKSIGATRKLIYIEDQFLWGGEMSSVLVRALEKNPDLHVIGVLPRFPDLEGWFARDPQMLGRMRGILRVLRTAPERVAFYGLENPVGTPVYVHAKVCVLDDVWASIGSDNFCRRSWTNDSELSAAVVDLRQDDQIGYARRLRLTLAAEHLDRLVGEELTSIDQIDGARLLEVMSDCVDPVDAFQRFAEAADTLEDWYAHDRVGSRPPGRLRRLPDPRLPWPRQLIAAAGYRLLHDPDARTWRMRLRKQF